MKLGKNVINLVRNFAPAIAAGLGGPVAGQATQHLANLLGKPGANQTELESAIIGATPEQLADIKESDQQFEAQMKALDIDVYKLEVDDRKDARDMAKQNMVPQMTLSVVFIVGYFGLMYLLFFGEVNIGESMRDTGNILIGVMTASIPQIMSFWFGSSHGSKSKGSSTPL